MRRSIDVIATYAIANQVATGKIRDERGRVTRSLLQRKDGGARIGHPGSSPQ
jgi:hypothetical protein